MAGELRGSPCLMQLSGDKAIDNFWPKLTDGSFVPENLLYRVRFKVLRMFGDRNNEADWDSVVTVRFNLPYSEDVNLLTSDE